MKTLKIRQTIALVILCLYFIVKILGIFDIQIIPQRTLASNQQFIYYLGSGHGFNGDKCGSKSVVDTDNTCFYEWIFNWNVKGELARMLDSAGIKYVSVNNDMNSDMSLDDRIAKVNEQHTKLPKIYISIHANASANEEANGFEVYSPKGEYSTKYFYEDKKGFSDTIANMMYQNLKVQFPTHKMRYATKSKDFKEASFRVITHSKCYSILTENEFFTNPEIRKKMRTKEFIIKVAVAHFNCIKEIEKKYKKL